MTNSPPSNHIITLAKDVATRADTLVRGTLRLADRERVASLVQSLASPPDGTRHSDLLLALGVAVAVQAKLFSEEMGISVREATSVICTALAMLAQTMETEEIPAPGDLH